MKARLFITFALVSAFAMCDALYGMTAAQLRKNTLTPYNGTFTRDISTASGSVSYTGVGFKPRLIVIQWVLPNAHLAGGVYMDARRLTATFENGDCIVGGVWFNTNVIDVYPAGGGRHHGAISSFNDDGFTIAWTKTDAPTGTIYCRFIAFP